jgi:hypothetical protein
MHSTRPARSRQRLRAAVSSEGSKEKYAPFPEPAAAAARKFACSKCVLPEPRAPHSHTGVGPDRAAPRGSRHWHRCEAFEHRLGGQRTPSGNCLMTARRARRDERCSGGAPPIGHHIVDAAHHGGRRTPARQARFHPAGGCEERRPATTHSTNAAWHRVLSLLTSEGCAVRGL